MTRPAWVITLACVLSVTATACGGDGSTDVGQPAIVTNAVTTVPAATSPPSSSVVTEPAGTIAIVPAATSAPSSSVMIEPGVTIAVAVITETELAELERTLDEIDRALDDLEADLAADTE